MTLISQPHLQYRYIECMALTVLLKTQKYIKIKTIGVQSIHELDVVVDCEKKSYKCMHRLT